MEVIADINQLNLAPRLMKFMQEENVEYIYRGFFTPNITSDILSLAEANLEKSKDKTGLKKKIYFIIVECLQNITRHQHNANGTNINKASLFIIQRQYNQYFITTGNVILREDIEGLRNAIERINNLTKDELKDYYNKVLISGKISKKGGAGLGFIAIARKSGRKFVFDFKEIDEKHAFFYLCTIVPLGKNSGENCREKVVDKCTGKIKELHSLIDGENMFLNFNDSFNQEGFINFLFIIVEQMRDKVRKKVFNTMIEMLQNIVYYADTCPKSSEHKNSTPGIFFFSERENEYFLTSGNFILETKVDTLQKKLNFINSLSGDNLDNCYKKYLLDFNELERKPDLSLVEMKMKSKYNLNYNFERIDSRYSFFTLQIVIGKRKKGCFKK